MTTEPIDTKIKELIAKPENRIKLHDLVHNETEKLYDAIDKLQVPAGNSKEALEAAREWLLQAEEASATLVKIFAYGCYFGSPEHAYLWKKSLERLAEPHASTEFQRKLELYPVMLLMYAGGVSAVTASNGAALKALIDSQISNEYRNSQTPMGNEVNGWLFDQQQGNLILGLENHKTPISDHVHEVISKVYPDTLANEKVFTSMYDQWDIIMAMSVAHYRNDGESRPWAPVGRFAWRSEKNGTTQLDIIQEAVKVFGSEWLPIKIGMFNSNAEAAEQALEVIRGQAGSLRF